MITDTLRKCPFCGSNPMYISNEKGFHIHCFGCGLKSDNFSTTEEVFNYWNNRKSDKDIDKALLYTLAALERAELGEEIRGEDSLGQEQEYDDPHEFPILLRLISNLEAAIREWEKLKK